MQPTSIPEYGPKKPSKKLHNIRPLPNTSKLHAYSNSAPDLLSSRDGESKYDNLKYNPTFLRSLQKEAESGETSSSKSETEKETKSNPITQLLSSLTAFNHHSGRNKKKLTDATSSGTQSRRPRHYKLLSEPVQTIKTIQPKYVLTSHVSEALLKRRDIWDEGFKIQRPRKFSRTFG